MENEQNENNLRRRSSSFFYEIDEDSNDGNDITLNTSEDIKIFKFNSQINQNFKDQSVDKQNQKQNLKEIVGIFKRSLKIFGYSALIKFAIKMVFNRLNIFKIVKYQIPQIFRFAAASFGLSFVFLIMRWILK